MYICYVICLTWYKEGQNSCLWVERDGLRHEGWAGEIVGLWGRSWMWAVVSISVLSLLFGAKGRRSMAEGGHVFGDSVLCFSFLGFRLLQSGKK